METTKRQLTVPEFFSGQSIFITGVTGLLGKALVEKILRSCPDIKNIYVLVRPKRGYDVKSRVDRILSCPLFQTLKSSSSASLLSKVVAISGDMTLPNLGLSSADADLLHEEVSIVIHSAATVRFDEPLKKSVKINVEGTKKIIELAKQMKHLKAVVHVSTAYSNCEREEIDEKTYPTNAPPNDIIQTLEWMPDDMANCVIPKLLTNKPNTYTYTKHLAEQVVQEAMTNIPICIVRPSIVAATYEEPIPGWVDNFNGPSGIFVAYGKGILRTLLCYDENKLDVIPLDHVVSLIISAAWYTGTMKKNGIEKMSVFNCCSGSENPFYLKQAVPWAFKAYLSAPFSQVLWYPSPYLTPSPTLNSINEFLFHLLPAQLMDLKARLCGEKPLMMFFYHKVRSGVLALRFFCTHEWKFTTNNTKTLYHLLPEEDQQKFKFDIKKVDWKIYTQNYVLGLRRYTMKEDDSSIVAARKNLQKMYVLHRGTQAVLFVLFILAINFFFQYTTTTLKMFSTL